MKTKKGEGPTCACGKVDLYMESLKLKEKEETAANASDSNQTGSHNSSADEAGKGDTE